MRSEISEPREGWGLSEGEEINVPIPNGDSHMLKVEQPTPKGACLDKTFLPSLWEGSDLMRMPNNEILKSSDSLGCVLIVTKDPLIRDFLGQIVKLHGYHCEYFEELPKVMMAQTWKGFDALFIESHSLDELKRGLSLGAFHTSRSPIVVVLGDLPPSEESGFFHVLKKPLDYRQMGRLMDECLFLKTQRRASQAD